MTFIRSQRRNGAAAEKGLDKRASDDGDDDNGGGLEARCAGKGRGKKGKEVGNGRRGFLQSRQAGRQAHHKYK